MMAYRDDLQAARMRREALDRELHEIRELIGEIDDLREREHALEREIAQATVTLEHTRARTVLARAPDAPLASPCRMSWDLMRGGDYVRCCGRCGNRVFDISDLGPDQARRLLQDTTGRLHRRADGTLVERDCPVGRRKRRAVIWSTAAVVVLAGVLGAGAWLTSKPSRPERYCGLELRKRSGPKRARPSAAARPRISMAQRLPDRPANSGIVAGLNQIRARVMRCDRRSTTMFTLVVKTRVHVAPDGRVTEAEIRSPANLAPEMASCVQSAVKDASFARSVKGRTFTYPFVFR